MVELKSETNQNLKNQMEIWKQIQNFEKYSISSFGNLKATNNRGREYRIKGNLR